MCSFHCISTTDALQVYELRMEELDREMKKQKRIEAKFTKLQRLRELCKVPAQKKGR